MNHKTRIAGVFALLLLLGLIVLLLQSPPAEWDRAIAFGEKLQAAGITGVLWFAAVTVVATAFGLPRQVFAFTAGFAFGVVPGLVVSTLSALAGCALAFYTSRRWLSARVESRFASAVRWLNNVLRKDAFLKVIVLRLQPLGTNLITNVCAGLSAIPASIFLASSGIGYVPQMLVFNLMGSGIRIGSTTQLLISGALLLVSLGLGWLLYYRYRLELPEEDNAGE